jgi:hypothetical protein
MDTCAGGFVEQTVNGQETIEDNGSSV